MPFVLQSNAADRGRSGCRPYYAEESSIPHPGCSLWTLLKTQSGEKKIKQVSNYPRYQDPKLDCKPKKRWSHLDYNLQSVQNDQIGLGGQVAIYEGFMIQFCSGPSMGEKRSLYMLKKQ